MWVEFVVCCLLSLYSEGPGTPVFHPTEKPTFPNFNLIWIKNPFGFPSKYCKYCNFFYLYNRINYKHIELAHCFD